MSHAFPWMADDAVKRIMTALGAPAVDVRFVGGCVRDALAGRAIGDIDIATPERPEAVQKRLENAGVKTIPTGLQHGTVTGIVDGRTFEITTLRRDTACDGRHAAVEFTADWKEDASRRDFTINAMSLTAAGTLHDYFGGEKDLKAGVVRFVGAASDRIQEDYLRVLRLFRFHAVFGRVPIDAETLKACALHTDGLKVLSAERIRQEMAKLLSAPAPVASVAQMRGCGVLQALLPEAESGNMLAALLAVEAAMGLTPQWVRRLAALVRPTIRVRDLTARLKLTNAEADLLAFLMGPQPQLKPDMRVAAFDLLLFRHGRDLIVERMALTAARDPKPDPWRALFERAAAWAHRPLPISGDDLLAEGVPPGPAVGRALRAAEEFWAESGFQA
ncbi:MAG: CCA tRNA nucleotidyltransferase, partial [Rhodospirillaceae bacterium]|nr:CCA tRNA nucleotidyltransferase [Rhodospirillaceae bacterium]